MYWIALTLGFFGSLHCLGMCGPLAMAVTSIKSERNRSVLWVGFSYNIGRILGYVILGLFFGLLGNIFAMAGAQKMISISLGLAMIVLGLLAIQPDHLISKISILRKFYLSITTVLTSALKRSQQVPSFLLGMVNGFLPCGMVYLAIGSALSLSSISGSMGFMLFFGLGTFPAMMSVAISPLWLGKRLRLSLSKLYPIISIAMGAYLIYRGWMSKFPLTLDFFEALRHPIMCH